MISYELGLSRREIAAATGCSLGTVSSTLSKAKAADITYPVEMTAKQLGSALYPPKDGTGEEKHSQPDLENIHREMQRKGVTLTLLWEEYKTGHPDGLMYTQFCQRYRDFRKQNDVYMRKQYKAGERLETDWAGLTLPYGEGQKAYFFVAALPASACLYVEPFRDMESHSWITVYVNAFTYFGGVPRILVPDNCKTAVQKADYYDPDINRTYGEMARHYGVAVIPARPRKPRDKPHAENGVQIAERRIIAKLRNRQFLTFEELREATLEELDRLNRQPFQKLPGSRLSVFLETEKDALRPLPASRFEYAEWKTVKAGMDYHVEFDGRYYSVPYQYAGRQLDLRATANSIEVLCEHECIASHVRNYTRQMRYTTDEAHMPENHRAVADWTPERFLTWARKFGTATEDYIGWQMEQPEIQSLSFEERLGMLVDAEWTAKHARRIQRYIRQGEFRVPAVAEDVEYVGKQGITKEDFLRLCDGGYLRNKQNVILSGPAGVGKTYLACALGNSACRQCIQARYLRVPDLLFLLFAAKMDGSYMKQRKKLAAVPLLILDDWALPAFSPEDTQEMMELTELRYGRASTVIAGQLPCDKWYDLFPDPTLADACPNGVLRTHDSLAVHCSNVSGTPFKCFRILCSSPPEYAPTFRPHPLPT